MKASEATNDRRIFSKPLIAVQLDEIFEEPLNQIQRVRTIGVARELHALERSSRFGGFLRLRFLFFVFAHVRELSEASARLRFFFKTDAAADLLQSLFELVT